MAQGMIEAPLSNPFGQGTETARYSVRPREHRVLHTALDAHDLFTSKEPATVTWARDKDSAALSVHMPVSTGEFTEKCTFTFEPLFRPTNFERSLRDAERISREERADFTTLVPKLPDATYPETMLPFLLRGHPRDGERRSLIYSSGMQFARLCEALDAARSTTPATPR